MKDEHGATPEVSNAECIASDVGNDGVIMEVNKAVEKRCPNCQALLDDEQRFCPDCGASFKRICPQCNTELQDGEAFCPTCGQRASMQRNAGVISGIDEFNQGIVNTEIAANKKRKIFSVAGIVLAVIAIFSYFICQSLKVSEYKENAKTFCFTVISSAANLENIGNEIQSEWHDYIYDRWSIYDSVDDAVAGALSNKSKEINEAKSQKAKIDSLYSKLKKPANKSNELEEVCEAVKALYDEYTDMYDFITSPSGNYNSFKSGFGSHDSDTLDAYEDLKELCDALN